MQGVLNTTQGHSKEISEKIMTFIFYKLNFKRVTKKKLNIKVKR
jgi:hypothetical protein